MNRRFFLTGATVVAFSLVALVPLPAMADKLDDLRMSGAVGEAFDGFARARNKTAKNFVIGVNSKRRKIYVKRAKAQGVSVDQVGQVYSGQIVKKAPSGTWILSKSGKWAQKK